MGLIVLVTIDYPKVLLCHGKNRLKSFTLYLKSFKKKKSFTSKQIRSFTLPFHAESKYIFNAYH